MPIIPVRATGFPPGVILDGLRNHDAAWADLVWAAITVGKRELFDLVRHGQYSLFEIVYRSAILFSNLKETDKGRIERSAVYDGLDPSEKGATSYFLGLVAAKLLAAQDLDVPWLMHLDVYRDRVDAVLEGRSRPDLIGQDRAGNWVVLESKGRTGDFDRNAMRTAKRQATQIRTIDGVAPFLRVAVQAHFSAGVLRVDWEDPPTDQPEADVRVTAEELKEAYYRPFRTMFEARRQDVEAFQFRDRRYDSLVLPEADLRVGIAQDLDAREGRMPNDERWHSDPLTLTTAGSDGILVRLGESWGELNMRQEPQSRVVGMFL